MHKGLGMDAYLKRMARYNQWMNQKLLAKTQLLSDVQITEERGAFFGSILGTFNHLYAGDVVWLRRVATHPLCQQALTPIHDLPSPKDMTSLVFNDLRSLAKARESLDQLILDFAATWTDKLLNAPLQYRNMAGEAKEQPINMVLHQLTNHQTHHRGQITTLLFQAGIDPGVTDLLVMLMEEKN